MELITILNRCHRFRGFVYQQAHFSADKKSIEVAVRSPYSVDLNSTSSVVAVNNMRVRKSFVLCYIITSISNLLPPLNASLSRHIRTR
jgi:hypothetical protein